MSHKCIFLGYGDSGEMGYRLWDPVNGKIIRSNDVIFDETCMYKEPARQQEPGRVIFDDEGHQGQQPRAVNQPLQQQNQPLNDAADGPNGQPNMAEDIPLDIPQLEELPGMIFQPYGMEQEPPNGDMQAGQPPANEDNWVRRSTRPSRPPD